MKAGAAGDGMVRVGWNAGAEQFDPLTLLELAVAAEKAGFELISVDDHFHPWSEAGQACFAWTWLGAAAARLDHADIGTSVTCPILRYNPAVIAQAAATLDRINRGPVHLGMGTGEALNEYSPTGRWPGYRQRRDMIREAIGIIRALWSGEELTFDGKYFTMQKARLYTPPRRNIPIHISSLAPGSAFFAGYHGDGLLTAGDAPEILEEILDNFNKGARMVGKDPRQMPKAVQFFAAYTDDVDAAVRSFKEYWAGTMADDMLLKNIYTPRMSAARGAMVKTEAIESSMCISADPEVHAEYARRFVDLGFDRLMVASAGPDPYAFIEGYGRNVLPLLRGSRAPGIATGGLA